MVAAAALAGGQSAIRASALCDDDLASLRVAQGLGAPVETEGDAIKVSGIQSWRGGRISCGESGLALRMFSAIAALSDVETTLAAEGSLARRPVGMISDALTTLGATCTTGGGLPPVAVRGPISGGSVTVDGSETSQFLTGLLIALPRCEGSSMITVENLRSRPYVALTLSVLARFGVRIGSDEGMSRFEIEGGQVYRPIDAAVEGDWSAASMLAVCGATAGRVTISGLDMDSAQADRAIVEALKAAGAVVEMGSSSITVSKGKLRGFSFDMTDCPDLAPALAALALGCEGQSEIRGAARLAHKESDRAKTIVDEIRALGADVDVSGDIIIIRGGAIGGGRARSHGDHRIAMMLAVAALAAEGAVEIDDADCVAKSWPGFFYDLSALGARVT